MKTKEDHLRAAFGDKAFKDNHNVEFARNYSFGEYPDSVQRPAIYNAMQQFADQEKQALKEKLKEKVKTSKLPGLNKALVYAIITEL